MIAPPPPPHPSQLPYGTVLRAGLGTSTVIADMDFETYSEAGYLWNPALNKWTCLPSAPQGKKGLQVVGSAVYSEHPSTEVLTLSYNLKDGKGTRRWHPGQPLPLDLFQHLARGLLVEAWNVGFERQIWENVCVPRYGFPPLPRPQLRCAMAKARAHALPGALGKAGEVLGLTVQKDKEGKRLIDLFCVPRNPTKGNPSRRIRPEDAPEEFAKLCAYCDTDIETEAEASSLIPDLTGDELAYWQADQEINARGVAIDLETVNAAIQIIEEATRSACAELLMLTGGAVDGPTKVAALTTWLHAQGVHMESMDEEAVEAALARDDLPDNVRRVLELRRDTAGAAVKKMYSLRLRTSADGRCRNLFNYHAARTGRCTGDGPQPTNMPNTGETTRRCEGCGKTYGRKVAACPHCGADSAFSEDRIEWGRESCADAVEAVRTGSAAFLEYVYGPGRSLPIVSSIIRSMFTAGAGCDLIIGDYSAIEAVGAAMLSGEQWRIDVFRTHGKIYEMSAALVTGTPFAEFMQHIGYTPEQLARDDWYLQKPDGISRGHHPLRKKVGKVTELACLSAHTQVLTDRGYLGITGVTKSHKVWDGLRWVNHSGVVRRGIKNTVDVDGVRMTPDHLINCGPSWKEARELASNKNILTLALATASENLPRSALPKRKTAIGRRSVSVRAALLRGGFSCVTSCSGSQPGAIFAPKRKAAKLAILNTSGSIKTPCRKPSTAVGCLTGSLRREAGARMRKTACTETTAAGGLRYATSGKKTRPLSSSMFVASTDGTTPSLRWIGRIAIAGMNLGISGSSLGRSIWRTNAKYTRCKPRLTRCAPSSLRSEEVFDIKDAGPDNRFCVRSNSGHLRVHNCGYAGWIGAMKAFGADEFMDEAGMKESLLAWRAKSPAIVELWGGQFRGLPWDANRRAELYGLEGMAVAAIQTPGVWFDVRHGVAYRREGDALYCRLPSGRLLTYHRPRLTPSDRGGWQISYEGWNTNPKNGPMGWIRMQTHGGKLLENVDQAACRDLLAHATLQLERAGYRVALHVYDEVVSEIEKGRGSIEEHSALMASRPAWAEDWPVRVGSDAFREERYRK